MKAVYGALLKYPEWAKLVEDLQAEIVQLRLLVAQPVMSAKEMAEHNVLVGKLSALAQVCQYPQARIQEADIALNRGAEPEASDGANLTLGDWDE